VLEDVGVGENGAKAQIALKYSHACWRIKLQKNIYELGDNVGEKALNLNMSPKLGFTKKIPFTSFPNCLLKNIWVESVFPYAPLLHHEGVKQNTIGVIKIINFKLSHHKNLVLTYSIENEMPFVCHIIKW
jgi:hypothetical protein